MMDNGQNNRNISRSRTGVILLVTLMLLVVLATLGYTLTSRVAAQRHRNQYMMDYSQARYGCDSAVKYALAAMEELNPQPVGRPNEPDFSDLFALDEAGYQELLAQWNTENQTDGSNRKSSGEDMNEAGESGLIGLGGEELGGKNGLDSRVIRGPYGPSWPFVTEPVEFEIGPAKVRIEIEDEEAKYPLGWALLDDREVLREVEAGFVTFCEMSGLDAGQIDALRQQLTEIGAMQSFKTDFKPITKTVTSTVPAPVTSVRSRTTQAPRKTTAKKVIPAAEQAAEQTEHFARLFHSSLLDTESLAAPTIIGQNRQEFPLKYMGLWGSRLVNINTAPRHVLEAAFIFGGSEVAIAEEIILLRREEPFPNVEGLKTALTRYTDSIGKCEKYITTESRVFTIRITATSGAAKASTLIAVTKEGNKVRQIAAING
ncbi:MAG: hypothetical protein A2Z25_21770 [Planctomycetes bacterium RBG_16_55_9]|nr:MAG: hypothetical protein A2Z25_21770 [Planctomycetes bacterium RBG_16_55_9]